MCVCVCVSAERREAVELLVQSEVEALLEGKSSFGGPGERNSRGFGEQSAGRRRSKTIG